MAPTTYKNVSNHPIPLDDGRSVGVGERVELSKLGDGDQVHVDSGMLVKSASSQTKSDVTAPQTKGDN